MSFSLGELAVRFGCELHGDPDVVVDHVATLTHAGAASVTFLANPGFRKHLGDTKAGVVILEAEHVDDCPVPALVTTNPYAVYARLAVLLHPSRRRPVGIHASAQVAPSARIAATASVGPCVVVDEDAEIGDMVEIGPGSVVGRNVHVGADTRLAANVTLCDDVVLGERVILHPGVVIGADGFGIAREPDGWVKVPQLGAVRIGDDVEIGAGTTVDRGAIEDTVIENGVKLDNLIQVAHNVRIGEHTVIAALTGISGSTEIGKRCMVGGQVGFVGHLKIGDDVVITGRTLVNRSVSGPGVFSSGLPMDDADRWRKNAARFRKLDELVRQVRSHDKQLSELQVEEEK